MHFFSFFFIFFVSAPKTAPAGQKNGWISQKVDAILPKPDQKGDSEMKCSICGIVIDDIEKAIEEGWTPSFWDGENQHDPACAGCSEAILEYGEDGEFQVKDEYRGKVKFLDDQQEVAPKGDLVVGIMLSKVDSSTKH